MNHELYDIPEGTGLVLRQLELIILRKSAIIN